MKDSPKFFGWWHLTFYTTFLLCVKCQNDTIIVTDTTDTIQFTIDNISSTTEYVEDFLYIFNISYTFKDTYIPHLIADKLGKGFISRFTTSDILNVIDSNNLNLNDVKALMELYDVDLENVTDELVNNYDLKVNDVIDILKNNIQNFSNYIPSMLTTFGISNSQYVECVVHKTDKDLYELLKTGNYTNETINAVLTSINVSEEIVFDIMKPFFMKKIVAVPIEELFYVLNFTNKLNKFHDMFAILNISGIDFKNNMKFSLLIHEFTYMLNTHVTWAVPYSTNKLVSADTIYKRWDDTADHLNFHVINVLNESEWYDVLNITKDNLLSSITVDANFTLYYEKTTIFNSTNYCRIIKQNNASLEFIDVPEVNKDEHTYFVNKRRYEFIEGSPLICGQKIYGILSYGNGTTLGFASVENVSQDDVDESNSVDNKLDGDNNVNKNDDDDKNNKGDNEVSSGCNVVIYFVLSVYLTLFSSIYLFV